MMKNSGTTMAMSTAAPQATEDASIELGDVNAQVQQTALMRRR
jgi:hypothetical protein